MTHLLSQNPTKQAIAPTVRFHDLLDAVECKEQEPVEVQASGPLHKPAHSSVEPLEFTTTDEPANDTIGEIEEADIWEQEVGFDEVIEQPTRGSAWGFDVVEEESLDLSEPALRDLLSDQPVPGVVARGMRHPCPKAHPTELAVSVSTPLSAKPFKF